MNLGGEDDLLILCIEFFMLNFSNGLGLTRMDSFTRPGQFSGVLLHG